MNFNNRKITLIFFTLCISLFICSIILKQEDTNVEKTNIYRENINKPNPRTSAPPDVSIISPSSGTYGNDSLLINASITSGYNAKVMINASMDFNLTLVQGTGNYWSSNWDNISKYTSGY